MADFFDKVKEGFNKNVAVMSTGSKNMIEKSKINTLIKNLEDEKKQLLELLGNKIYNFCKESPEGDIPRELVASFCNEVDGRLAQIEVQRARIAQLDAEMNQVRGGGAPVGGGTKMCPCGHPNADTAKFCAKCGNPF
ncbi:MAG: zinc ribbon domain-containing protein [Clostridia bacterium]|nr:zinc ribbon domain-containing protein [Clostridia bacterium]